VEIDEAGLTRWVDDRAGRHVRVDRACAPERLGAVIENLMARPSALKGCAR